MGFERYKNAGKFMVMRSVDYLPRIFCRNSYIVDSSFVGVLKRIDESSFDPKKTVIVETAPGFASSVNGEKLNYTIESVKYSPNRIEIAVKTETPAILVLSDQYYKAFKCRIDGKNTRVFRANGMFRGVAITEGIHKIVFYYDSALQIISLLISIIGFVIIIFIWITDRKKKYEDTRNNTYV